MFALAGHYYIKLNTQKCLHFRQKAFQKNKNGAHGGISLVIKCASQVSD